MSSGPEYQRPTVIRAGAAHPCPLWAGGRYKPRTPGIKTQQNTSFDLRLQSCGGFYCHIAFDQLQRSCYSSIGDFLLLPLQLLRELI